MESYSQLILRISTSYPKFRVIRKSDSKFMKVLDLLVYIVTFGQNSTFISDYITTIGYKVYVPDMWVTMDEKRKYTVMCHELAHIKQYNKYNILFYILYLLFPIPLFFAYFRAIFEMEAYAETLKYTSKIYGIKHIEDIIYRNSIISIFTGPGYGWMMLYRPYVEKWYDETVRKIKLESNI